MLQERKDRLDMILDDAVQALGSGWLSNNFESVVTVPKGEGYLSKVPGIYSIMPARRSLRTIFESLRGKFAADLLDISGFGETVEESRHDLTRKLAFGFSIGKIRQFCSKSGQSERDLDTEGLFEIIKSEHRLHDHSSSELYDFAILDLGEDKNVVTLNFDKRHTHLKPLYVIG